MIWRYCCEAPFLPDGALACDATAFVAPWPHQQEEGEFNGATLLLALMRALQLRRSTRSIVLLSATPMQTHPWEPWDLLQVLGEGGAWLCDFATVRHYYGAAAALGHGACSLETARAAALPITLDPSFPPPPGAAERPAGLDATARVLAFATPGQRPDLARWLRAGSPLGRRMHRNTRTMLRRYHELGLLEDAPTRRKVDDKVFDFAIAQERAVYDAITGYIDRRFQDLEHDRPGKGFVMTVYRRRAASSPFALERSLRRRQEALEKIAERRAYDPWLETDWDARDLDDPGDVEGQGAVSSALPADPRAARAEHGEIDTLLEGLAALHGRDTKRDQFFDLLRHLPVIRIVNLFLRESVDERVYRVLRQRCGLFEHFVGPMQPVLARARRMLLGQEGESTDALEEAAAAVDAEPLAVESYLDSEAEPTVEAQPPLTAADLRAALGYLSAEIGVQCRNPGDGLYTLAGVKGTFGASMGILERHPKALPLSPLEPALRDLLM